jgi:4-hydroxybenzoate polyprenyltransferase
MVPLLTYGRLVKFSHTAFAMPFALLAAFLAGAKRRGDFIHCGWFWLDLALVVLAMVAARSAAMAFNRIVDRGYDAANPRTAARELPTGRLTVRAAWIFYALCSAAFFVLCGAFWLLEKNPWPILLALPVLAMLSGYSFAKRFTAWCHVWLGASLGISPLAAWVAISPDTFGLAALVLGAAVVLWVAGFDVLYSLQDLPVDLRQGLHSLPAALGPANAIWISRAMHLWCLTALAGAAFLARPALGPIYLAAVGAAAVVLVVQQALVRPNDFSRINSTFTLCNGAVSLLLGAAGIADVIRASCP